MEQTVHWGVLGASRIARSKHIPAAAEATGARIVAVASRDQARAEAYAAELNIPRAYGSYDALLDDASIDAVLITLPNSLHAEWAIKAARAGKHVLCEKPLAPTAAEGRAMFAAAAEAGVVLMEGFWIRFHPQLPLIREAINSGAIGEIRLIRAELTYTIADWGGDSRTRADLAGGALLDAGCYCVHIIRHLMGAEPHAATGFQRVHPDCRVDSTFTGLLAFDGGRMGCLATSMEAPFRVCCEIIGTAGRIHTDSLFGPSTVTLAAAGQPPRVEKVGPGTGMRAQLEHVSACIRQGTIGEITAADSLGNAATLEALKRAAETGRAIDLP
ncbi:MAG: Gfo/Idh/MocA family oxidoreductase [Planctomycetes bacterium]|nr:Gfo/Idh/MocA family oxidoreductase [Planctomycetota bacterium]